MLEGSNPKEAAPKIFAGAFQNSGQVCIAIKRAYVHESIYDACARSWRCWPTPR
ncbi:MAG: aldehyde dehydrogenase family protein [Caulobacteraceae bacterium]